jgi:hypothetical protein
MHFFLFFLIFPLGNLVTFGNFCNFAAHLANGRGVLLVLFRIKYINKEIGK